MAVSWAFIAVIGRKRYLIHLPSTSHPRGFSVPLRSQIDRSEGSADERIFHYRWEALAHGTSGIIRSSAWSGPKVSTWGGGWTQANWLLPLLHQPVEGWEREWWRIPVVWRRAWERPLQLGEASVVKGQDGEEEEEEATSEGVLRHRTGQLRLLSVPNRMAR